MSVLLSVVTHAQVCPKCSEIPNYYYLTKEMSDRLDFLHTVKHQQKLNDFCHFCWVWSAMSGHVQSFLK